MIDEKIHIIIAESAPIISAGLSHTVSRIQGMNLYVTELRSPADMQECLRTSHPEILIVNPWFGGVFNPLEVRAIKSDLKIIAFETTPLPRETRTLYDGIISIVDDVPEIAKVISSLLPDDSDSDTEPDNSNEDSDDGKETVSSREKEIIALVAKGLTNKEIAEKLFLSVHTVITHRRNIARKLEIHSATGLTIYAIVNKLVDLSEIKM